MTLAMVNVLPDPVTPSNTWRSLPPRIPFTRLAAASFCSASSLYFDCRLNMRSLLLYYFFEYNETHASGNNSAHYWLPGYLRNHFRGIRLADRLLSPRR